ncbi:hypothetical protein ACFQ1M_18320 [Sungkyunkwania multivorans]|uniref:Uncharacterized protein n=1 Tax=Sungkyunkwania multivorans TaxID=1173618 RepID=A0ABW3D3W1_9FLAO
MLKTLAQNTPNYSFLQYYDYKELPLIERTRLDEKAPLKHLTRAQKKALHFKKITEDWEQLDCGILYKLNISNDFKTLVVYYYWGEELRTLLANYDLDHNFIDAELVAFDENAEGWSSSKSTITKHRIHRMDALYTEPEQIEYSNFVFKKDGEIVSERGYYNGTIPNTCVHYFSPQEIKYVQALNGLNVRDENGHKIGKLNYGDKVEIIKYTPKKLTVIDSDKTIVGNVVEICNYESGSYKRRYVFDGYLVADEELRLFDSQLDLCDPPQSFTILRDVNRSIIATDHIDFSKKFPKVKDEIRLPLTSGEEMVLKNKTGSIESREAYSYVGFVKPFNAYLIEGGYYEEGDFFFVDRASGEITTRFPSYPYISPDRKTIVCFYFDPYLEQSKLYIYKESDANRFMLKKEIDIKFWTQNLVHTNLKWTSNNSFIINITPIAAVWNNKGDYNTAYSELHIELNE